MKEWMNDLNRMMNIVLGVMQTEDNVSALTKFCVLGVSEDLVVHLEPSDFRSLDSIPQLSAHGVANFSVLFLRLKSIIEDDVERLKDQEYPVVRPLVLLVTGAKNSGDEVLDSTYDELIESEFSYHPNLLAVGIGIDSTDFVRSIASGPKLGFVIEDGEDVGSILANTVIELMVWIRRGGQSRQVVFHVPEGLTPIAN